MTATEAELARYEEVLLACLREYTIFTEVNDKIQVVLPTRKVVEVLIAEFQGEPHEFDSE